jgi:hypothetical protein
VGLEETALKDRVDHLRRTFVPPHELTGSRPRDVALTAGGRALHIVAMALFGLALTAGLLLSIERQSRNADRQSFQTQATATTASVTRLWRESGDSKQPRVAYRYVVGATAFEGESKIRLTDWRSLHVGSELAIRYLPNHPARSLLAGVEPRSMPFWVPSIVALGIATVPALLLVGINRQRRLLTEGRAAAAVVTKLEKHQSSHGGSHRSIRYSFPLLSGSMATGKSALNRKGVDVGSVICIVYDPDRPGRNQPYPLALVRPTKTTP